jgi:flagellar basal-body rod modification protein FlgD
MTSINTNPSDRILTLEEMQPKNSTNGAMGKDQFLKLFVAQLQHQDPMNPMNDSEFMGQMASFSTLEQVSNLAAANERVASNLTSSSAIGLIGRTVSYVDENDQIHTGKVDKVTTAGGVPTLTVDGVDGVDPSTITQVA